MQIKTVYIYSGIGGAIQTVIKLPMQETKQLKRLIADEGKVLVKGEEQTTCIDVEIDDVDNWSEIEEIIEQDMNNNQDNISM